MKFTKAAILSALSAAANVKAQSPKAGKNGAGLSDFEFPTSANFEGKYELCFQTSILTTRFGVNSTFNICRDDDFTPQTRSRNLNLEDPPPQGPESGFFTDSIHNITIIPTDAFNAYQAEIDIDVPRTTDFHTWKFQGFADPKTIKIV